jgi:(E)-4-hydroxy-3-methylbut-2-enyl-diphosphate synthase
VIEAAAAKGIPIRIGVNAGSLEKQLLEKYGGPTPEAAAESALNNVARVEAMGFTNLIVSIKASDIWRTVQANRLFAKENDIPLHLGITEAGRANPASSTVRREWELCWRRGWGTRCAFR